MNFTGIHFFQMEENKLYPSYYIRKLNTNRLKHMTFLSLFLLQCPTSARTQQKVLPYFLLDRFQVSHICF